MARGSSTSPPLLGRQAELVELNRWLDEAGGLKLIAGEAGIGKTRLVRELATLAGSKQRTVIWARPEEVTRPGAFSLIIDLLESVAQATSYEQPALRARSLADQLLNPVEGAMGPDSASRRVAAEVRGLFAQLGASPVAVFEDLHIADDASQGIIAHWSRSSTDDGQLLVCTYRPEEVANSDALARFLGLVAREQLADVIELSPLSERDASAMVRTLSTQELDEHDIIRILALADGIPFFIEELSTSTGSGTVPWSITHTARARLQGLSSLATDILRAASLQPGVIDPDVLGAAFQIDRSTVMRLLVECSRAGMISDVDGVLAFRHALVKESVRADISRLELEQLQARLATATEAIHSSNLAAHAYVLASHWYGGRNIEKALDYALLAGERSLALGAVNDARHAYELALACGREGVSPPSALEGLAEVALREGDVQEAETLLNRAARSFLDLGQKDECARALGRCAWVYLLSNRIGEALSTVEEALSLASSSATTQATLLSRKGRALLQQGQFEEARQVLVVASDLAREAGDHAVRADSLDSLAIIADEQGLPERFLELSKAACTEALLSDRPETIGRTHNNRALMLLLRDGVEEALSLLAVARERFERSLGVEGAAIVDLTEALAQWRLGNAGEVRRLIARHQFPWAPGYLTMVKVWSHVHCSETDRAQAAIAHRWRELEITRNVRLDRGHLSQEVTETLIAEMILAAEIGSADVSEMDDVVHVYENKPADEYALVLTLAARLYLVAGRLVEASASLDALEELLLDMPSRYFSGWLYELRGRLSTNKENSEQAALEYSQAHRFFASMSNTLDASRVLRLEAELLVAQDLQDDAVAKLRQARDLAQRAGSKLETGRSEVFLRQLGVRPRAGRPKKTQESRLLSPREEEVVVLVASGMTNAEIASNLFISERTVQDHIGNALRKKELSGRAALAAWAVRNNLL